MVKDPLVRIGDEVHERGANVDVRDRVPQNHLATPPNDSRSELFGNEAEVNDRRSRNQQRREPLNVWLAVTEFRGVDQARSGDSICLRPVGEVEQTGQFIAANGNDDFSGHLVGKFVFGAVGAQELATAATQRGLERPGRVIDARMHDVAVVTRLLGGNRVLLVDHRDCSMQILLQTTGH